MAVAFIDHKNDWILDIIGRILVSNMVFYGSIVPKKQGATAFYYNPK